MAERFEVFREEVRNAYYNHDGASYTDHAATELLLQITENIASCSPGPSEEQFDELDGGITDTGGDILISLRTWRPNVMGQDNSGTGSGIYLDRQEPRKERE